MLNKIDEVAISIKSIKQKEFRDIPAHWVQDWLLHVINKQPSFLITDSDYSLTPSELSEFEGGIAKMQAGMPLAYLTGTQAFWSLDFNVNEYTLIPRPDTEVLVEQVLGWIEQNLVDKDGQTNDNSTSTRRLLDLGTGSGCIAISLAHELAQPTFSQKSNKWQVTAIDFSAEALKVAKQNAVNNKTNNVDFLHSSWFDALLSDEASKSVEKFDVIVSNPPYIVNNDEHLAQLTAEPITALVAEDNGLSDIKNIVDHATNHLVKGGLLAIEHGYDQGNAVRDIYSRVGYKDVKTVQDYGGNDRVTMGVL